MPDNLTWDGLPLRNYGPTQTVAAPPPPPNPFANGQINLDALISLGTPSSLESLWIIALAVRASYTADKTILDDVASNLGCPEYRVFNNFSVFVPRVVRFSAPSGRRLYAICGTTNIAQWALQFFNIDQVETPQARGRVLQSFNDIANSGWDDFLADVIAGGKSVVLAGHSLGGAVATMWGHRLPRAYNENFPRGVITFGCPRVGNEAFATDPKRPTSVRVVTRDDIVPRIPARIWARKPDGPLSVVGQVVSTEFMHEPSFGVFLSETFASDFTGDTGTIADGMKAMRMASAMRSFEAPHLMPYYADKLLQFGDLQRRVTSDRLVQYLALDGRLRSHGL